MDLMLFAPEISLVVTGLAVLLIGLFIPTDSKKILGYLAALGVLVALFFTVSSLGTEATAFNDTVSIDALSQFFKIVFLVVALLFTISGIKYTEGNSHTEEFFTLGLFATIGMMFVASANDLMVLFVGFELASLATYALAGFEKKNAKSLEAAMKYFIIGSLSAALMLLGISYVYGATGTTSIPGIAANASVLVGSPMGLVAVVLLMAGFGFKIALVPFHMWAPDTYQGSPSVVSALLAAGSKKMGIVAALKVFVVALIALQAEWQTAFAILAVITMTYGNMVALKQTSVKRMLAYSSLAQAGYITMAFVVLTPMALGGGIFYALSHGFMKAGAFIATAAVTYMVLSENKDSTDPDHIDNFRGLGKRMPVTALSMTVFVFALAGIPLTAGYMSKFILFSSTIQSGFVWLAIIAILNSAISLGYYAKIVKYMYFLPTDSEKVSEPLPYTVAMIIAVIGVLAIGFWSEPVVYWAMEAAKVLVGGM
ncbi:F(420)H(2) dehydrogenase subunit N [Methanolobus profundi]|uniref:F420H2 dehydrogenase subunit N n=1 Tax=Methanolobus profundi TaxID=487685 RepID=A0A1I4NK10_9EURY|nr:F(420)H(2) dehydrogenase subunit N [Methanolobus profundi]SFM15503.1 F420H2 dehydrogenase subunit N [Methanolobus profundi]